MPVKTHHWPAWKRPTARRKCPWRGRDETLRRDGRPYQNTLHTSDGCQHRAMHIDLDGNSVSMVSTKDSLTHRQADRQSGARKRQQASARGIRSSCHQGKGRPTKALGAAVTGLLRRGRAAECW
jgi:hypothetical protein